MPVKVSTPRNISDLPRFFSAAERITLIGATFQARLLFDIKIDIYSNKDSLVNLRRNVPCSDNTFIFTIYIQTADC